MQLERRASESGARTPSGGPPVIGGPPESRAAVGAPATRPVPGMRGGREGVDDAAAGRQRGAAGLAGLGPSPAHTSQGRRFKFDTKFQETTNLMLVDTSLS